VAAGGRPDAGTRMHGGPVPSWAAGGEPAVDHQTADPVGAVVLGGFATLFVVGTLVITVMHGAGSDDSGETRGGFRMGVGVVMLVTAWILYHRPAKPKMTEPSWKVRLRDANPLAVFVPGAVLYSPSASFLGQ
jgi:hypothetical protein